MQTDLSCEILQEQHDTHASWLPRACLFRVFTTYEDTLGCVKAASFLYHRVKKILDICGTDCKKEKKEKKRVTGRVIRSGLRAIQGNFMRKESRGFL